MTIEALRKDKEDLTQKIENLNQRLKVVRNY